MAARKGTLVCWSRQQKSGRAYYVREIAANGEPLAPAQRFVYRQSRNKAVRRFQRTGKYKIQRLGPVTKNPF